MDIGCSSYYCSSYPDGEISVYELNFWIHFKNDGYKAEILVVGLIPVFQDVRLAVDDSKALIN